jgi:Zn-dependent peptidase ImmA (M78 family)
MYNYYENLTKKQIFEIEELAKEKRRLFDIGTFPLGTKILKLVNEENIKVIYFPVENKGLENNFSGVYVKLPESYNNLKFIGINSSNYNDQQIFAIGHELYHHYEATKLHISRNLESKDTISECKADFYAAEFLLPLIKIKKEIKESNDGNEVITNWNKTQLLRFIAKIHCDYEIPFRVIVYILKENKLISMQQFEEISSEDERDPNSNYYKIGLSINEDTFIRLNSCSKRKGVESKDLEDLLKNYEEDIISSTELAKVLDMFNKTLADFGIEEEIDDEDLDDMDEYY